MTNEMKYSELLKEIGALLADKNLTISSQRYQIEQLEQRLKVAEAERDEANKVANITEKEQAMAQAYIERMEGGAA